MGVPDRRLLVRALISLGSEGINSDVTRSPDLTVGQEHCSHSIRKITGVFSSLYPGYLNPSLRVTSSTLSAVANGVATIMMFVFIDPQMSVMTDDVVEGKTTGSHVRRVVLWLVGSRLAGMLLAQLVLALDAC
jgi:hypothetical protein